MSDLVKGLFDCFIDESIAYNKTKPTIHSYKASFNRVLDFDPAVSEKPVHALDRRFVINYTLFLTKEGMSTASVNHYLRDIRVFLYWCMKNDYIVQYKVQLVKERKELKEPYTKEELRVLFRKPENSDPFTIWRDWAIIHWIIGVASRAATVTNILMSDIDLKEDKILTRHNKNGNIYSLSMPPELKKVLVEYLQHRTIKSEYLFCGNTGECIQVTGLHHSIAKYNRSRGINKTSIHLFRHSFGMLWAENGGDVFRLQKIFNHSDIKTTQGYVNLYTNDKGDSKFLSLNPLENLKEPDSYHVINLK